MKMIMENWRNNTDRGKPKYSARNLSRCHFVHHITGLGPNPGLRGEWPSSNHLGHGKAKALVVDLRCIYENSVRIAHINTVFQLD
jgi:hypothetical protein